MSNITADDFLFEIGCEELPASSLVACANAFQQNVEQGLNQHQLQFSDTELFYTPRRIAILVKGLAHEQPDQRIERQGPAEQYAFGEDGLPTVACLGFLKSCNANLDNVTVKETERGRYVFCELFQPGKKTAELLPDIIEKAIAQLPIPKPMRWADHDYQFIRPVHWILALHGRTVIPMTLFGKQSDQYSHGHRFLRPGAIKIHHPNDYQTSLFDRKVIVSAEDRKTLILQETDNLPLNGSHPLIDDELLNEVCLLVEWPVVLLAQFKPRFLDLPAAVLVTSMQEHQRCFATFNDHDEIQPYFIVVSNIESDNPQRIIEGNQRVVNARLADAEFFYQQDQKTPLQDRAKQLKQLIFQKKLGSIYDKTTRIEKLANWLADVLSVEPSLAKQAANLSKCDLVTLMVYEFPELQGIMGYHYALLQQEDNGVALALKEQYLPRFSGDTLPSSDLGRILALSDRIDTIVGILGINKHPTGDRDPFALRRAAIGIIRILIELALPIDFEQLVEHTIKNYKDLPNKDTLTQTVQFIKDRLKHYYQSQDIPLEMFYAVADNTINNLADFDQRIRSLTHFVLLPEAKALAEANKRVNNILKKQGSSDKKVDQQYLVADEEKQLYQQLNAITDTISELCNEKKYSDALTHLATLKEPIDRFFDNVMIMAKEEDLKNNRLALLKQLQALLMSVADISQLSIQA